jgi:peptide deformylase
MTVRPILQLGNPTLWEISDPVTELAAPATQTALHDLWDTLHDFQATHGFGRAIAAPQIGALQRIIVVDMGADAFQDALVNPEITWASDEEIEIWDDCFSFPELLVRVRRAARIRVTYRDTSGTQRTVDADGDLSELLQHEIDHLDGILAVQRALSPRAFCTRAEWERRYKQIHHHERG